MNTYSSYPAIQNYITEYFIRRFKFKHGITLNALDHLVQGDLVHATMKYNSKEIYPCLYKANCSAINAVYIVKEDITKIHKYLQCLNCKSVLYINKLRSRNYVLPSSLKFVFADSDKIESVIV